MLRSLNSLAKGIWPSSRGAVGVGFSGDCLLAVRAERTTDGHLITHVAQEHLPFTPFREANPRAEDSLTLAQAMRRLAVAVPQMHWPLQIALPDAAAIFQVMKFDSLPGAERERSAIARFRLEKEWPAVAQMECATQVLNEVDGNNLMLALAVQRSWLDCLRDACQVAGWVPNVIDIAVNHAFNRIHDAICETAGDGALILIEADSWSILFWDQTHCPRFVRSRWRDCGNVKEMEYELIAKDVERLVRAYVLAEAGRRIERVCLSAAANERAEFSEYLDARMRVPCMYFDMTKEFAVAAGLSVQDIAPAVLAAAVPRS